MLDWLFLNSCAMVAGFYGMNAGLDVGKWHRLPSPNTHGNEMWVPRGQLDEFSLAFNEITKVCFQRLSLRLYKWSSPHLHKHDQVILHLEEVIRHGESATSMKGQRF